MQKQNTFCLMSYFAKVIRHKGVSNINHLHKEIKNEITFQYPFRMVFTARSLV